MSKLLYLTTDAIEQVSAETERDLLDWCVHFIDLSKSGVETKLPPNWKRLHCPDVFDLDAFRCDFLSFLEEWPKKPIWQNKSFDQWFRRRDGYSVWWTSVGASRTGSDTSTKEKLKKLWILDQVLCRDKFDRVILNGTSHDFNSTIALRCQADGIPTEWLGRVDEPMKQIDSVGLRWLIAQLVTQALLPIKAAFFASMIRLFSRGYQESSAVRLKPAVLFRPNLTRLVQFTNEGVEIPFFAELLQELEEHFPEVRRRFLLRPKLRKNGRWSMIPWLRQTGVLLLEQLKGAVPPAERYSGLGSWAIALPSQIVALFRYCQIERSSGFRSTMIFAGADISSIIIPGLRRAIENLAEWERGVGSHMTSFSKIGNLKAIFLISEFYLVAMSYLAAAKRLKIPVIGIQHGTIHPNHFVYTVPQGHVDGAPIPDYFAAYGEYDRKIVSELGAYPAERVWVVGSPRMDYLVKNPPDKTAAREQLGLPVHKKIVLIATHTHRVYPWFFQVVKAVFEATKNRNDCIVIVKTHPGDKGMTESYKEAAKHTGNPFTEFYADQFDELLAACDVMISGSSTTVMQATLLGRATISANFSEEPSSYPYVEDGASLPARNPQELSHSLEVLLSDDASTENEKRRQEFLRRHLGPTAEGGGAKAFMELIKPLLKH